MNDFIETFGSLFFIYVLFWENLKFAVMAVLRGFLRGNWKEWMAGKPRSAGLGGWWGREEKGARITDHGAII